ncbi:hypothetical protein GQ55_9G185900 [Panicum hallii var. hallii]|uniref:Uncharacterized protein n=1 Tax=Panicum hallii var. hallii TaxID=1504633 RepID=A0A2T7C4N2_9POAL|nr:hypothetical protein GQ55_9G185900 [Panicum hallii var. hallii]
MSSPALWPASLSASTPRWALIYLPAAASPADARLPAAAGLLCLLDAASSLGAVSVQKLNGLGPSYFIAWSNFSPETEWIGIKIEGSGNA